jgi:hypothetical protein
LCLRWLSRKKFPGGSEAGNWWLPRGIIFILSEMAGAFAANEGYTVQSLDIAVLVGELLISILVFLTLYRKNGYEKD